MTVTIEMTHPKPLQQVLQQIAMGILILVGIEVLNQFLIVSGSVVSHALQVRTINDHLWVGVYQQIFQAAVGILLHRFLFRKGVHDLGINLNNKTRSVRYAGWSSLPYT